MHRFVFSPNGQLGFGLFPVRNEVAFFQVESFPSHEGLAGFWPADWTVNDRQENFHGDLRNGTTFAPGIRGGAFQFDGHDDFVWIAQPRIAFLESGAESVALWANFASVDGKMVILDAFSNNRSFLLYKGLDQRFWLCLDEGPPNPGCASENPSSLIGSTSRAVTGVWLFLTAVITSSEMRLYVNGRLEAARPVSSRARGSIIFQLGAQKVLDPTVAGHPDEARRYRRYHQFHGRIDEVARFRRELRVQEIAALQDAARP